MPGSYPMTCQRCGTAFVARNSHGKWCSKICADRAYRERHSTRIGKRGRSTAQRERLRRPALTELRAKQESTAQALGVGQGTVSKWNSGKSHSKEYGGEKRSAEAPGSSGESSEPPSSDYSKEYEGDHGAAPAKDAWRGLPGDAGVSAMFKLPLRPDRPRGDTRRARAVARLMLGDDPETVAEYTGLELEEVAALALRTVEEGWFA